MICVAGEATAFVNVRTLPLTIRLMPLVVPFVIVMLAVMMVSARAEITAQNASTNKINRIALRILIERVKLHGRASVRLIDITLNALLPVL